MLLAAVGGMLVSAAPASAGEKLLKPATYPDLTTYRCMSEPIDLVPGQNLNLLGSVKTCPNAEKVSGPGDVSDFNTSAEGYMTRFEPSMVEVKDSGKLVTPSVWDLHLHHAVWLSPVDGGPSFAVGEEKTIVTLPQGYGYKVPANATWPLNYMIHSLNASTGRQVRLTWEIDWVPTSTPSAAQIRNTKIRWMDVAGYPEHLYPVFDAERGFDQNGDGKYTFPDEVPTDSSERGYEEREKIGTRSRVWTVPRDVTLVFGAGHLHPGGLSVDISVTRDGVVKPLFRSDAKYYERAGAVSWDVALEATPRNWRVSLKAGDKVTISTTYNVKRASWYESMGILPIFYTAGDDPRARDPFDDAAEVAAMYDGGRSGDLTHGRLPENVDRKARKNLKLPDPRKLRRSKRRIGKSGVKIKSFLFKPGGYAATRGFPKRLMRPPVVGAGRRVKFTNLDALPSSPQTEQAWHSVTSCKPPCNRGAGIGYPLAQGPIKFDSGELGFGKFLSEEVTAGTNVFRTPRLRPPNKSSFTNKSFKAPRLKRAKKRRRAKTYTYFCRIHPFMRGSVRVVPKKKSKRG